MLLIRITGHSPAPKTSPATNAYLANFLPNPKLLLDQLMGLRNKASIIKGHVLINYFTENNANPMVAFKRRVARLFWKIDLLMGTAFHPNPKLGNRVAK